MLGSFVVVAGPRRSSISCCVSDLWLCLLSGVCRREHFTVVFGGLLGEGGGGGVEEALDRGDGLVLEEGVEEALDLSQIHINDHTIPYRTSRMPNSA